MAFDEPTVGPTVRHMRPGLLDDDYDFFDLAGVPVLGESYRGPGTARRKSDGVVFDVVTADVLVRNGEPLSAVHDHLKLIVHPGGTTNVDGLAQSVA